MPLGPSRVPMRTLERGVFFRPFAVSPFSLRAFFSFWGTMIAPLPAKEGGLGHLPQAPCSAWPREAFSIPKGARIWGEGIP